MVEIEAYQEITQAEKLQRSAKPDLTLYKKVKRIKLMHTIIKVAYALLVVVFMFVGAKKSFEISLSEGIISTLFMGGAVFIVSFIIYFVYLFIIEIPIEQALFLSNKKRLKNTLGDDFSAGSLVTWKSPLGLFAVDYQKCVLAISLLDEKYEPHYINADDINSVNLKNRQEITMITETTGSGKQVHTQKDKKDDFYLEIHYQSQGQSPNWIRIPFGTDGTEAHSIASAILRM